MNLLKHFSVIVICLIISAFLAPIVYFGPTFGNFADYPQIPLTVVSTTVNSVEIRSLLYLFNACIKQGIFPKALSE